MNRIRIITLLCFCTVLQLHGQDLVVIEQDLAFHADGMTNLSVPEHRQMAADVFQKELLKALSNKESFDYPFDSLKWCQKLVPSDTAFRLFTWQVQVNVNGYKYYGVIQKPDGALIVLNDKRSLNSEYASYDQNTWYGALYYGIESFSTADGETNYLILGFNAHTANSNQKVADVLQVDGTKATFGSEVFISKTEGGAQEEKSRILIDYAESASGRMQFDREKKMLIFDHLITINAGLEGPIRVPDGSFHGYEYKEGKWYFVDKVFHHKSEKPPGTGSATENNGQDIFGKKNEKQ